MPTSMTVVATSTWISPARKRRMTSSRSSALSRPCTRPTAELGPPRREALGHRRGRAQVGPLRLLDHRQHDVRLAAPAAGTPRTNSSTRSRCAPVRTAVRIVPAPRRPLPEGGDVEVAVERERERARDRRGGEQQDIGCRALADQRRPLLDAEAVLLVDHDEAEPVERDALLHQRVGAHHQPRLARGETPADRLPSPPPSAGRAAAPAGARAGASSVLERRRVLLGEELGRAP